MNYRELIIDGDDKILKGFLAGYKATKHIQQGLFFCKGLPIDINHLGEVLRGHRDYEHVICTESRHKSLVAAINRVKDELDIKVVSDHVVSRTYFSFKFETFSHKVAIKLKRFFRKPPVGIELVDFDPKEEVDPSAKGVEVYSPAHEYKFSGKGSAQGDLVKLLKFHDILDEHDFVKVKDISIEHP